MATLNDTIIKQGMMYGKPCVLFKHLNGFAWSYDNNEIRDLGFIMKEEAIRKFDSNFALDARR